MMMVMKQRQYQRFISNKQCGRDAGKTDNTWSRTLSLALLSAIILISSALYNWFLTLRHCDSDTHNHDYI